MSLRLFLRPFAVVLLLLGVFSATHPPAAHADTGGWADHWSSFTSGGAAAEFSDDTTVAHSGQAALKATDASGLAPNVYGTISQTFATKPNTTYDFHAWVRSTGTSNTFLTVTADWVEQTPVPDGSYDWQEISFQHRTSATETSLTFRLVVQDITSALWLDDVSATEDGTSTNLLQAPGFEPSPGDAALYQRFTTLQNELPTLQASLQQARRRAIPVDYPTVDEATISRFLSVGRADVAGGHESRAGYIAGILEQLYAQATTQVQSYLAGTARPLAAPRYTTGRQPLQVEGRSFVGDTQVQGRPVEHNQNVFLTGYGHFNEAETDIPLFHDLGTDAIQFEIGPASTIFPADLPGWQPQTAGAVKTTFERDATVAHSGRAALRIGNLTGASSGASGTLTEQFGTRPDTTYHFSMWVKGSSAGTVNLNVGTAEPAAVSLPTGTYGWRRLSFSYTSAHDENTLTLTVQASNVTGSTWLDDVTATPAGGGGNAIDNGGFERTAPAGALFSVDDSLVRSRIIPDLVAADRNDIAVNLLLSPHYMPQFVYDETPSLRIPNSGFLSYDINNPVAKQVVAAHIHTVMSLVKSYPSLQSVTLTNEPIYPNSTTSTYTQQGWHDYLRQHYPDVTTMNALWKTNYASFDAVPPSDGTNQTTPYFYDWVQFNDTLFAGWHAWMGNQVHSVDPAVPVQAKIMWGPYRGSDLGWGVDVEQFDNLSQISGDDNYGILQWGPDNYVQESEFYDLQSTMKDAPVFNSEDHMILDNDTDYEPLQATNARLTLWQGAIHGRTGSTTWLWSEQYNSMLVRPDVVDQIGRTGLDLNRLADQVTAFQNAPPTVGLLYSVPSRVYSPAYIDATNNAYKALVYDGVKPGFVSEGQAAAGGLNKYKVLVLAGTTNVPAATLTAIQRFEKNGGKVVLVGSDSLSNDEHNQPLNPTVRQAVYTGAAEVLDAATSFDAERATLLTNLQQWHLQNVVLVDGDGNPLSDVEYETSSYHGKVLLNIASYSSTDTKQIYIEVNGRRLSAPVHDLLSGTDQPTGPLTLKPLTPVLLQLPG